ncbi:hypothetical protein SUDANB96_03148 [Streptomyces sp. enrichment culture]
MSSPLRNTPYRRRAGARRAYLTKNDGLRPRKLGPGRVHRNPPLTKEHPVILFFEILLVLVVVGVIAFAGLAVKKLYQGQR